MDDLIAPLLTALAVAVVGWLLGIAGFFRANRALAEVARLRTELLQRPSAMPGMVPGMVPEPTPPVEAVLKSETPPAPELPPPLAAPPARPARDWEELLTARWGVWLGAGALLLAAVFLVRYASDQDLLGPGTRCLAAVLGGVALVAAAEWLQRRAAGPARLADHAPGALAAGGVGAWFAASYTAGIVYGLVPPLATFGLLAASSWAGLMLSLRFGPLVASVGVLGGFATPFLAGGADPYLPFLFAYFLFVAGSALAVVRYTAWVWLGWAVTVACAGLTGLAALSGSGIPAGEIWGPALFAPAAALLNLVLLPGPALDTRRGRCLAYIPVAALGAAALLLSAAAPIAVTQAAVLLVAAITLGKGAAEARLNRLPWLGAALFLALLALWGLPAWQATGEAVTTEGEVIAVLPGDWTPVALRPLLLTACGGALAFFAAGLWGERRRPGPLDWSGLSAAVPVLALALLFWRVAGFQAGLSWAAVAVGIAAAATAAAVRARPLVPHGLQSAGIHAAGATAALALACGMLLSDSWLTLALALFIPALAVIEDRADLPPLRRVALAVAAVVGVRLLLNGAVLDALEGQKLPNTLVPAYVVGAASLWLGARLFRRRADDAVVAVLELGSAAFVAALAVLEVRMWATAGHPATPETGFAELAADTAALSVLSAFALHLGTRTARPALRWAAAAGGLVSLVLGAGLIVANPAFTGAATGTGMLLNPLLLAYPVPAAAALWAARQPAMGWPAARRALVTYALAALFAYVTLAVRQAAHPGAMGLDRASVTEPELWAWSGAWLAFGLALMAGGIVMRAKALRLTALAIVALTAAKVFLFDMAGLGGLWRVVSFLGLGLTLIALGAVYRRFVAVPDGGDEAGSGPVP